MHVSAMITCHNYISGTFLLVTIQQYETLLSEMLQPSPQAGLVTPHVALAQTLLVV